MKENNFEYVDLGLPSGTKWAKCNVGAEHEEDAGLYFQFGDINGYNPEQIGKEEGKKMFTWNDYKFSVNGRSFGLLKYDETDNKEILDIEDDAAHVNMGGKWRIPTKEDMFELLTYTDVYMVNNEGKEYVGILQYDETEPYVYFKDAKHEKTFKGLKFYKKEEKDIYIFIPAAGGTTDDYGIGGINEYLFMWLANVCYEFVCHQSIVPSCGIDDIGEKCYGNTIRGVFK